MNVQTLITMHKYKSIAAVTILLFIAFLMFSRGGTDAVVTVPTVTFPTVSVFDAASLASSTEVVEANGSVETLETVDLSSEVSARVARVYVSLGDDVRRGQTLVVFNNADLVASRDGAEADLESARASRQSIEAQYAAQEAQVAKVETNSANSIAAAKASLGTAANNLRTSANQTDTEVVRDAYADMVLLLLSIQNTMQTTLTTVDNMLGIDGNAIDESLEAVFSAENSSLSQSATQQYDQAKNEKKQVDTLLSTLIVTDTAETIDSVASYVDTTLETYRKLLVTMSSALDATPAAGDLSQTTLDGYKTQIVGQRSTIVAARTNLTNQSQTIASAKSSFDSLEIAFDTAERNLAAAEANAAQDIAVAESQLAQIEASLALQDAQIKSAAARVASVQANISKTVITAPISGTVAALNPTVGELMSPGALVARIVNTEAYQIKTYVAAEQASQVVAGNAATIASKYAGTVTNVSPSIDPTTNKVEVIVLVTSESPALISDQFVPVSIELSNNDIDALIRIPLESVRLTSSGATVLVVNSEDVLEERSITIGQVVGSRIEADISAITEPIITSVRGLDPGKKVTVK